MHDLKDGGKTLHAASQTHDGWRLHQSGLWDSTILCDRHENVIAKLDDYGVKFWRDHRAMPYIADMGFRTVPNPNPLALVKFAYSIVWRWTNSHYGNSAGKSLGPYEAILRDAIFNDGPSTLPVLLFETDLRHNEFRRADIGVSPYRTKLRDRTGWLFRIGTLDFFTYCDQRGATAVIEPHLANGCDPVEVFKTSRIDFTDATNLMPLVERARRRYSKSGVFRQTS